MNESMLKMLKGAPLYTWESGIRSENPDVLKFYNENKKFYVVIHHEDGRRRLQFFTTEGDLGLVTSSIIDVVSNGSYRRFQTRNTVYHLIKFDPKTEPDDAVVEVVKPVQPKPIDVKAIMRKIYAQYPYASYGSPCSAFSDARRDKFVTDEEYAAAQVYYGRLWHYAGD